jgi:hypothetical protein
MLRSTQISPEASTFTAEEISVSTIKDVALLKTWKKKNYADSESHSKH